MKVGHVRVVVHFQEGSEHVFGEIEQTMKALTEYDRSVGSGITAVLQNSKQEVLLLTILFTLSWAVK